MQLCAEMDAKHTPLGCLSILLLVIFFSTKTQPCAASDTILAGQSLTANQSLISQAGIFELGFFSPGNSLNYYIGIWYKTTSSVQSRTVVWVANRDRPIKHLPSSELKLLENGNLVLVNQLKIVVWSSNSTSNNLNSSEAVLRNDGNLVIRDGSSPPSSVIWQSFDHPTDTWLPGGRLKYDNITKKAQKIVSWKNSEDPAPGLFSLELQPDSQYVMKWNGSHQYWTSGVWDGQSFSLVPEMKPRFIYNFSYVSNENETYFTYYSYNRNLLSRLVIDSSGHINQVSWLDDTREWNLFWSKPLKQCDVYAICGAFGRCYEKALQFCQCLQGFTERSPKDWNLQDWTGGCARKTPLQCGERDKFLRMPHMKLPINSVTSAVESAKGCSQECLKNCSCNAYAYTTGCSLWFGDLLDAHQLDNGGDEIYIRVAPSEIKSSSKNGSNRRLIAGAAAGTVALVGLVLVLILIQCKRGSIGTSNTAEGSLVAFTYKDLQTATNNFSEKLGGGAFGSVFKAMLPDSTSIAVKKLQGFHQGEKQFRSEISTVGTIQHVNLVRLRGFCSEGSKRLLVYDYMPNTSLDAHLFPRNNSKNLDWKTRYSIALGTARGLAYLHEKCRDCIIHCDIKPENILLDADFCPKVADFGLAKLMGREFSRVLTTMRGTRGYLAPEWISGVAITAKADVYSYGMTLFEIISGRRNWEQYDDGKIRFFPTAAASKVAQGDELLALLDNKLEGDVDAEELRRALRAACWCIQDDEFHRPSMGQVVQILEGVLEVKPTPIPRSLEVFVESEENVQFFLNQSNYSSHEQANTSNSSKSKNSSTSTDSY